LEDTYYIRKIRIVADKGMILTNGTVFKQSVLVPEAEVEHWKEIVNDGQM
jgi:hypothetical protein